MKDGWISVEDRLPAESTPLDTKEVLAYSPTYGGTLGKARYVKELGWQFDMSCSWTDTVTHWMPLPDPPMIAEDTEHAKGDD